MTSPADPQTASTQSTAADSAPAQTPDAASGPSRSAARTSGLPVFLIAQLVLTAAVFGYGTHRYQQMDEERLPPEPNVEPISVAPQRDVPAVVSDDQLVSVLRRLQPKLRGPQPKINFVDHALRFWGVTATFADEDCLSGVELRDLLTDHRRFQAAWGDSTQPFLLPNTAGDVPYLAFRTRSGDATASHYDHTLAGLAEVGTPLDFPVNAPDGEVPLRAAFNYTRDGFSLNQGEYEWSVMVFLHYMPQVKRWFTSEGQEVTWDLLAHRLMRQRLARGVCYGNHRLYTLAMLLQLDPQYQLLSEATRAEVVAYLQDVTRRLTESQNEDGFWDGRWPGEEWDGPQPAHVEGPLGIKADRLLATGHTLEWWAIAPNEVLPDQAVVVKAGQWLVREIGSLSDAEITQYYTFLSHAGRALALWRHQFPADVSLGTAPSPVATEQQADGAATDKAAATEEDADDSPAAAPPGASS